MPTFCFIIKIIFNLYKKQTEETSINEKLLDKQIILPPECMQKIFKYTVQISHKKTLFTFLFVNKYWSENVIPILWHNPFGELFHPQAFTHRTPSRDPSICYKLLRTYIDCLDSDEYYFLFSKLNPLLHPFDMQIPNSIKTLYNYSVYLRELSYGELENTIYTSFMTLKLKNPNYQQEKYQVYLIASSLCKLFLQNSTQLQLLLFNSSSSKSSPPSFVDMPMDLPNLQKCKNAIKPVLSNITKFQFKDMKFRSKKNILLLLQYISDYTTKIKHLDLNFEEEDYDIDLVQVIISIIKSQRRIFIFSISNLKDQNSESILLPLNLYHKSTLFSLKLQNIHFTKISLNVLSNFNNLKNLYLYYCNGFNSNVYFNILNLKKLHVYNEKDDGEIRNLLLLLIKQTGSTLNQLGIDLVCNEENVTNVLNYCPNIIELFIINGEKRNSLEWKEKIVSCSKKVFVKNLNIKCNVSSKKEGILEKFEGNNGNNNRNCKEF